MTRARRRRTFAGKRVSPSWTYDAGALVAAERMDKDMWRFHRLVLAAGTRPRVPAVVLAQVWRGGPQANMTRLVKGCDIVPFPVEHGWAVGELCDKAGTHDVIDAAVVLVAAAAGGGVVTSDPDDIHVLAEALGQDVLVQAV